VSVSELSQRIGEYLSYLLVRVPQLAAETGLGAWPIAAVSLLVGVALLVGGVRLGPLLSGVAGATVGWVVASHHPGLAGLIPAGAGVWLAASVAGLACAFVPVLYPILLGVLPGASWGLAFPVAGRAWLGAVCAALVAGALCFVARRVILALTAAIPGVALIDAALLVVAGRFHPLTAVTGRPMLLAIVSAVLLVAGTAVQVSIQPAGRRGRDVEQPRERRDRRSRDG
jgi:hypothetical protein